MSDVVDPRPIFSPTRNPAPGDAGAFDSGVGGGAVPQGGALPGSGDRDASRGSAFSIDDLALPEGLVLDEAGGKSFVDLMNNGDLSQRDRANSLLNLHQAEIQRARQAFEEQGRQVWYDKINGWRDELRQDREYGGSRLATNIGKAVGVIQSYLPAEDADALIQHLDTNGMGHFRPFLKMMTRVADRLASRDAPPPKPERGPGNRGWYGNQDGATR